MMKYIMKIFGLVIILLISACEHETLLTGEPDDPGDISEDKVRLEIFARANSYRLPSTRALGDENTVEMTPWVLVFRGSGTGAIFVEAVQAFEFAGKRYVLLTKRTDGSKYQLLILANPMAQFYYGNASTGYVFNESQLTEKLIEGTTTLATACTNLLTEPASTSPARIPFSGVGETIPMSYLLEVDKVDNTTKIEKSDGSSLMLLRAVAKIVVVNEASNFELEGVSAVANVPRQGQLHNLIPASIMGNAGNLTNYQYDASCSLPLVSAETITNKQSTENSPIYIYETNTIGIGNGVVNVDDVVETANHFKCIDMVIRDAKKPITEALIKKLHFTLKSGTSDSRKDWFAVGEYKKLPNEVGGKSTTAPELVAPQMKELLSAYNQNSAKSLEDLLEFHYAFGSIHPFQDGNGRVGRLLLFKECLRNSIVPFIITDDLKMFYYRGLHEWKTERGYLLDTCLTAQDQFKAVMDYFRIPY